MKEFFSGIKPVEFTGDAKREGLYFRHYQPERIVGGKKMKEQLRFSMAYWHTICNGGKDIFGAETAVRSWLGVSNAMKLAEERAYAAFEFLTKMGLD